MPEIAGVSAGGMPTRVKCLHVHLAQSLAEGPGVNPFGDEVRDRIGPWWTDGPCVADNAVTLGASADHTDTPYGSTGQRRRLDLGHVDDLRARRRGERGRVGRIAVLGQLDGACTRRWSRCR